MYTFWKFWGRPSRPLLGAKGVARGKGEIPPGNRKNCCRKLVLFPKALFLVTNFRKIKLKNKNKNQFFNSSFIKNFQNFLKISQQFAFFVQTRKKLTNGLLTCFEKYAKKCIFSDFLRKICSQNFPTNCVFRPNARKTNAWFMKLFENMLK